MSESNEEAASPEPSAPAAKGGKLVIILALVNFLAVLGLGGYFFYTQQHAAAQPKKADDAHGEKKEAGAHGEKAEAEHEEAEEEEEEPKEEGHGEKAAEGHGKPAEGHGKAAAHGEEPSGGSDEHAGGGPLLALEAMVTNMADPDSDRYLKVSMQLRITSEAAKAEVEAHLVPVRNQILLYLSSLTIADTSGADNKREIQKRVKRLANEAMPTSRITQVYFTEFVIQ
jgi:flagellar FliL protein